MGWSYVIDLLIQTVRVLRVSVVSNQQMLQSIAMREV